MQGLANSRLSVNTYSRKNNTKGDIKARARDSELKDLYMKLVRRLQLELVGNQRGGSGHTGPNAYFLGTVVGREG